MTRPGESPRAPACALNRFASQRSPGQEGELLKRRAWRESGIAVVNLTDARLNDFERQALCTIADHLYGKRHASQ